MGGIYHVPLDRPEKPLNISAGSVGIRRSKHHSLIATNPLVGTCQPQANELLEPATRLLTKELHLQFKHFEVCRRAYLQKGASRSLYRCVSCLPDLPEPHG